LVCPDAAQRAAFAAWYAADPGSILVDDAWAPALRVERAILA
jgi:hypothetical protein